MKNILFFRLVLPAFFALPFLFPVQAQEIMLLSDIEQKDVSAISFEIPERHETVVLLFGSLDLAYGRFQAILLNERMEVVRRGQAVKLDLKVKSAENQVKFMGQCQDSTGCYAWWMFSNTFDAPVRGVKIDFNSLKVSLTGGLETPSNGEWWGGLNCGGKFYLLGKEKKRKEGLVLNMYPFQSTAGIFEERSMPVPEESVFADKSFTAAVQKSGRYLSRKNQFFTEKNTLYCLSEEEKGGLRITLVQPETKQIEERRVENPKGFEKAKAESLLAEGKIFRLLATPEDCKITIHALADGSILFSDLFNASRPDDVMKFSAPVMYVGPDESFKLFKHSRSDTNEIKAANRFLYEMKRANDLYLYLGISAEGYILRILADNTIQITAPPHAALPGQPMTPSASTVLYTHLHASISLDKNLLKTPRQTKTDVFDFEPLPSKIKAPVNPSPTYLDYPFHTIYAKQYLGRWNKKTSTYTLKQKDF